jgi:hypothetical protein
MLVDSARPESRVRPEFPSDRLFSKQFSMSPMSMDKGRLIRNLCKTGENEL